MKHLILVFFLSQSINALADDNTGDLTHFVESRNIVAAVSWDRKSICNMENGDLDLGADILCPDSNGNKFYSPTALIFKSKTGELKKSIKFFNEECPFKPTALSIKGNKLTMTAQVQVPLNSLMMVPLTTLEGTPLTEPPPFGAYYENCQYPEEVTTIRETRNLRTGELIKQIELQDHRTFDLP